MVRKFKSRQELININVKVGDEVLIGRFKNKRITIKSITYDEYGMPQINGKSACTFRIPKKEK